MSVLDTMSDHELQQDRILASAVRALQDKFDAESGPWSTSELVDFLVEQRRVPPNFARKAIWRLTGENYVHFVDGFGKVAKE